jgi:hypothetical protein
MPHVVNVNSAARCEMSFAFCFWRWVFTVCTITATQHKRTLERGARGDVCTTYTRDTHSRRPNQRFRR